MNTKQLYEVINNELKKIMPLITLDDIINSGSDNALTELISKCGHFNIPYTGDIVSTRNSVPSKYRRKGLEITYDTGKGYVSEIYTGDADNIVTNWSDDDNWSEVVNFDIRTHTVVGVATPETKPANDLLHVIYFASQAGHYTYFDDIDVEEGFNILYRGSNLDWTYKHVFDSFDVNKFNELIGPIKDELKEYTDSKFNQCVAQLGALVDAVEEIKSKHTEDIQKLNQKASELEAKDGQLTNRINDVVQDVENNKTKIAQNSVDIINNTKLINDNKSAVDKDIENINKNIKDNKASITENANTIEYVQNETIKNKNAIDALDTRVTTNEKNIKANESNILNNSNNITVLNKAITNNKASADAEFDSIKEKNTEQDNKITAIEEDNAKIKQTIVDNKTAINTKISEVESKVDTNASNITKNKNDIANVSTKVDTNTNSISSINDKLTEVDSAIEQINSNVDNIDLSQYYTKEESDNTFVNPKKITIDNNLLFSQENTDSNTKFTNAISPNVVSLIKYENNKSVKGVQLDPNNGLYLSTDGYGDSLSINPTDGIIWYSHYDDALFKTSGGFIKLDEANGVPTLDANGNIKLSQLGNVDTTLFTVVSQLPTSNIKSNKIYIINNPDGADTNKYIEYIYTGDVSATYDESKWEKLGEYAKTVDLSEYAKRSEVAANYVPLFGGSVSINTAMIEGTISPRFLTVRNTFNTIYINNENSNSTYLKALKTEHNVDTLVYNGNGGLTDLTNYATVESLGDYYTKTESDGKYLNYIRIDSQYETGRYIVDKSVRFRNVIVTDKSEFHGYIKLSSIAKFDGNYLLSDVSSERSNTKVYNTNGNLTDLVNYALLTDGKISTDNLPDTIVYNTTLDDYYNKAKVDELVAAASRVDLSNYVTKSFLADSLKTYVTESKLDTTITSRLNGYLTSSDLSTYATIKYVDEKINGVVTSDVLSNYFLTTGGFIRSSASSNKYTYVGENQITLGDNSTGSSSNNKVGILCGVNMPSASTLGTCGNSNMYIGHLYVGGVTEDTIILGKNATITKDALIAEYVADITTDDIEALADVSYN